MKYSSYIVSCFFPWYTLNKRIITERLCRNIDNLILSLDLDNILVFPSPFLNMFLFLSRFLSICLCMRVSACVCDSVCLSVDVHIFVHVCLSVFWSVTYCLLFSTYLFLCTFLLGSAFTQMIFSLLYASKNMSKNYFPSSLFPPTSWIQTSLKPCKFNKIKTF